MAADNIISIKELKVFNAEFSIQDSLQDDIQKGLISPEVVKNLNLLEAEDQVEYTLEFKKSSNGSFTAVVPESVHQRHNAKTRIEDYMVVSNDRAMEIL